MGDISQKCDTYVNNSNVYHVPFALPIGGNKV